MFDTLLGMFAVFAVLTVGLVVYARWEERQIKKLDDAAGTKEFKRKLSSAQIAHGERIAARRKDNAYG